MDQASAPSDPDEGSEGISLEDLPAVRRELFDGAVMDARAAVDPVDDLDGFLDELWRGLSVAFGWQRQPWPEEAPQPWWEGESGPRSRAQEEG